MISTKSFSKERIKSYFPPHYSPSVTEMVPMVNFQDTVFQHFGVLFGLYPQAASITLNLSCTLNLKVHSVYGKRLEEKFISQEATTKISHNFFLHILHTQLSQVSFKMPHFSSKEFPNFSHPHLAVFILTGRYVRAHII